jgi:hypothetical protein
LAGFRGLLLKKIFQENPSPYGLFHIAPPGLSLNQKDTGCAAPAEVTSSGEASGEGSQQGVN